MEGDVRLPHPPRPRRPVLHRPVRRGPGVRSRSGRTCTGCWTTSRRAPSCATSCRCTARTSPSSSDSRPCARPEADALVTREPDVVLMVRAARLRAGAVPRRRRSAPWAPRTAAAPVCWPGWSRAPSSSCAQWGARASPRGSGRTCAAPATRCPPQMQDEVAAAVPAARATTSWGTPSLDLGAGVRAQLEAARGHRGRRRVAVHPRVRRPLLLPSRRRRPRDGTRAWSGCEATGERPAAASCATGWPRSRSGSRAACADAGRDPADVQLVVVTKTFPASDVRLLAELGVTDVAENKQQELAAKHDGARRTCRCAGTSSGSCRATRPARSPMPPTSCTRSTGPSCWGRWTGAARALDVLLQVSLDPPGSEHRAGAAPDGPGRRWRTRSSRPSTSRCAA